ncbi:MAG: hypothetical protein HQK91_02790 [Nitrospirae bacterium]|nr:hypothetical protein [Nitrospirota bacterium]
MLKLNITKHVKVFLNNLDPKQIMQIARKIFFLMHDLHLIESKDIKGVPIYEKAFIEDYVIIYKVEDGIFKFVYIEKRMY